MAVKTTVENLEDVPEGLRDEYKETVDPKTKAKIYVLDLEGLEQLPAVRTLKDENARRRIEASTASTKLKKFEAFGDRDPGEILQLLDRIPELEAAAEGKLDEAKIATIVEGRVKAKLTPLERELTTVKTTLGEREKELGDMRQTDVRRRITDAVSAAARGLKVIDAALDDAVLLGERVLEIDADGNVVTKDGVGVTPGLSPKDWLSDMQSKRPHWWGPTAGGGATGNRGAPGGLGANPWTAENWNMTEQGAILRTDRKRAETLAKAAGTTIGGMKPKPKK